MKTTGLIPASTRTPRQVLPKVPPPSSPAASPIQLKLPLWWPKYFTFFFYAAFGSLFPLMGVYFKQIGMDAAQAGFLSGIRPIVEALAIPFWNNIASRMHKGKIMMLVALACWIIFTQPIGF